MLRVDTTKAFTYMWYIWRFVGVYPYKRLKWLYITYSILANLAASVIAPLLVVVNVFFLGNMRLIMLNLQISPTLIVASLKQFAIYLKLSDLQKVSIYLNALDRRASLHEEDVQYLKKVIKQCNWIATIVQIALISSLSSYAIPAFIQRRLVFEGWFPFDWVSSDTYYLIAYTFQLLSTSFQIVQNGGSDAYPPIYINVVRGQIHVLGMRVARIGKDPSKTDKDNYRELKSCVNDHKNIISLFATIKPVISQSVIIQFVITAFVLCVAMVHYIIFKREFGQLISTLIYMAGVLSESFPVCYFGNALIAETDAFTTAVYSCNWMDQPKKFRISLIIFMQRTQLTNVIQAGGLAPITLQTFIAIIRFSFSLFTMLSQMQ